MTVCLQLALEQPRRTWSQQVLPYGLAELLMITPSKWTLTESSREVRLYSVSNREPATNGRSIF
jgi:hypothetical protein